MTLPEHDIQIQVTTRYLPDESDPATERFLHSYTITLQNRGRRAAQLLTRHWVITDGNGKVQEVHGEGVVGEQPHLAPGSSFTYTSGCLLETPYGTMHGSYQMVDDQGHPFDAEIPRFVLATPHALH